MIPARRQLATFVNRFSPSVAAQARAALAAMRKRLPGAVELVYDNYNALAVAFGPTEKTSEVVFSIAVYPRWVSLFFFHGAKLKDPDQVLKGSGTQVRHIVLDGPERLDAPAVKALMKQALALGKPKIDPTKPNRTVVKSVSKKQRPRRPAAEKSAR
jgi:hypothetical protein